MNVIWCLLMVAVPFEKLRKVQKRKTSVCLLCSHLAAVLYLTRRVFSRRKVFGEQPRCKLCRST